MFDRRLKSLLYVLGVSALILVVRLFELQVVHAEDYRRRTELALVLRPKPLPFVRGSILDRTGEMLVCDEPCWDITVDYGVIAAHVEQSMKPGKRRLKRWRRGGWASHARTDEQIEQAFRDDLSRMWEEMIPFASDAGTVSADDLRARARSVHERIARVRRAVSRRRGFDSPVAEETVAHAIIGGLDARRQIAAREVFALYPWVHVEPATVRSFAPDTEPVAHVLGRMGRVDAEAVAGDPNADDPFAKYRADERKGVSGVELAAEQQLRGRRGQITLDRDGNAIDEECVNPLNGRDVTIMLHAELQRRLYRLLGRTVQQIPQSSGGAIVVLDVPSREILALVSYPSYDPARFDELYSTLRDDTERLPLRFRALSSRYAPGSTIKPLVCLAGLMTGRITLDTRETCTGYLFPDVRDRWRCWQIHGTNMRKAHGSVNVVEALVGSCNVFMYRLGEKLGVDRLCSVFDMVGVGKPSGTGLREEAVGINPTPGWLMLNRGVTVTPGSARLFAIGQGELSMTPIQVVNLMAVYAGGEYRPVTLIWKDRATPKWTLPFEPEHRLAIRKGMYGVVNDPNGTAHKQAYFENDRYALCGKTGSATVHPWPTSYWVPYVDEQGESLIARVPAGAANPAIKRFEAEHPRATFDPSGIEVASRWPAEPPPDDDYSHAWFGGFLQALHPDGSPDWSATPRVAFAVLVEFGGSGGRTSGPLAKRVAAELLEVLGPDLDPNAVSSGPLRRETNHP